jgi:P27 family predicted phage terminase small subunit
VPGNHNSGRRPQPTALKILRGNPGKRRLSPELEPTPPALDATFDTPPPELRGDRRAQAEWKRVAPLLRTCGLITQGDRGAVIALCLEWSTYLGARWQLQRHGVTTLVDGLARVSPFVAIADGALKHCQRQWSELGLTPSGRAKVARLPAARAPEPASKWGGML